MGTENKTGQNLAMESTEMTPPVTVSMKKLVAGVGTVFAGVLQMLEALEPQTAKQLMDCVAQATEEKSESSDVAVSGMEETEPVNEAATAVTAGGKTAEKPVAPAEDKAQVHSAAEGQTQTVTVDDLTRIIVRKVKQDRSNNEKIGSILKTYGVARVSELPTAKYEAFLTDISQL